jgi:thioredoxin reductase (NADPH)
MSLDVNEKPRPALGETPDTYGAYPRLSDEQLEALAVQGRRRRADPGETLYASIILS